MQPFSISTERLLLDQPAAGDIDIITTYCSDPLFEKFMTTPWPYGREHADWFVSNHAPNGWLTDEEWTWAIRNKDNGQLLGAVSVRLTSGVVGFWLGAPHRGRGIMCEALSAVIDPVFENTELPEVLWECVVGNHASSRVAEKVGFRFTGEAPGIILGRDGLSTLSWTAALGRGEERTLQAGWPA